MTPPPGSRSEQKSFGCLKGFQGPIELYAAWPPARKLQHRLHYDHHVEPNRLDLLFLPAWFLVPNLAVAAGLFAALFGTQAAFCQKADSHTGSEMKDAAN